MATLNIDEETKERFKKIKLDLSAKKGNSISEDELENILMNNNNFLWSIWDKILKIIPEATEEEINKFIDDNWDEISKVIEKHKKEVKKIQWEQF